MRRRDFITLVGGASAWPFAAGAQQPAGLRRVGVLMAFDENDPEPKAWLSGFKQGLAELGWTDGRNLGIDVRWAAGNLERMGLFAKKLVDLQPLPPLEAAAQLLKVYLVIARVHNDAEIEQAITALGREPGGGLIVVPDGFMVVHRAAIIALAARNNVPAVYWQSLLAKDGGLLSYGPDYSDLFRRAALYVDRILKGEKPSDLPVQEPTKFQFVINLKTAKALGLDVPLTLQMTADEVIE